MERLWIIGLGYLLGSISSAYLAGRWAKGIDLRRYGSGTLGGSMVYEYAARWLVVPVGLFDIAKAAFPGWLALRLGYGIGWAAAAGLAAAIGHNWPFYLGFRGGRGLGTFLGIFLALFPPGAAWLLGWLAVGFLLSDSAPWALGALAGLPLLLAAFDVPPALYGLAAGMLLVTAIKRLEANRRRLPPPGPTRRRVLWLRLVFDRDIPDHRQWIQQGK